MKCEKAIEAAVKQWPLSVLWQELLHYSSAYEVLCDSRCQSVRSCRARMAPGGATPISAALDNLDKMCIQHRIETQLIEPYASRSYHLKLPFFQYSSPDRNFSKKKQTEDISPTVGWAGAEGWYE